MISCQHLLILKAGSNVVMDISEGIAFQVSCKNCAKVNGKEVHISGSETYGDFMLRFLYLTCLIFHHLHLHSQKPLDQTRPVLPQTPNCGCVARRHGRRGLLYTLYYMLYYSRQILLKLAAAKIEVELNIKCVLVLMWFHQKLYLQYTSSAKRPRYGWLAIQQHGRGLTSQYTPCHWETSSSSALSL